MKAKKKNRVWISARVSPQTYKEIKKEAKECGSIGRAIDSICELANADRGNYYNP
jgi:hypothetical protein